MKKIVLGNDFNLIIPVSRKVHTSTGDVIQDFNLLPACTDLQVNLVNFNETISLPCSVDVEHTSRLIANVDSSKLNIGNYALEVKGKIYGNAWRSNEYEQIAFVNNNASADEVFDGEIIEGESSVEVDHVFIILPPTAGFTEIMDQASNVDINLNDANLEITRRTGEKKSFDLNTVNVEIGEGIKNIRRLTGSTPKVLERGSNYVFKGFDQFLLSQGNYVGIQVGLDHVSMNSTLLNYGVDNFILIYLKDGTTRLILITRDSDNGSITACLTDFYNQKKEASVTVNLNGQQGLFDIHVILFPQEGFINNDEVNDPNLVKLYLEIHFSENGFSLSKFSNPVHLDMVGLYIKNGIVSSLPVKLVSYEGNNRWVAEKNDGTLIRLNVTDNLVIGSNDLDRWVSLDTDYFDADKGTFFKRGSLRINGSGSFKDLVAKSLNVKGSTKLEGSLEVDRSITTTSSLKAGETTLEGTLHVEEYDIKTKSVYPAKTGGSYLKVPANGHVSGNYVVNKGNLGKGAHNYDKLFVENICWSDCTDPGDISTSLNGKGTYPIYKLNGFDGFPTFYFSNREYNTSNNTTDPNLGIGMYYDYNREVFALDHRDENGDNSYPYARWEFYEDGTINFKRRDADDDTHTFGILTNRGYVFDGQVKCLPTFYLDIFASRMGVQHDQYMYTLGLGGRNQSNHIQTICMSNPNLNHDSPILLTVIDYNTLSILSNYDETYTVGLKNGCDNPNLLYATDGSFFNIKTKADLVDGKIPLEQLGNVDRETVDFIADATTTEDVVTKFNQLLANLRSAGIMKSE